jgi:hypothetical protein
LVRNRIRVKKKSENERNRICVKKNQKINGLPDLPTLIVRKLIHMWSVVANGWVLGFADITVGVAGAAQVVGRGA